MKQIKILLGAFLIFGGLLFATSTPAQADTYLYNKAPKVLKGSWETNYRHYKGYRHEKTSLYVSNTQFCLHDTFTSSWNSGAYGARNGYYAMTYEKSSPRHYYVFGSEWYAPHSKIPGLGFGVVFTHSYKHFKLYQFRVTMHHDGFATSHRHYIGYFHRS